MSTRTIRTLAFAAGIAAVAALPLAARALREGGEPRCAYDGVALAPGATVEITAADATERLFCCVDCAQTWLARSGVTPTAILVTDESTGRRIAAGEAWFVRSRVPSNPVTGSRVHTFADENDALGHQGAYGGVFLRGDDRPLRVRE